MSRHRNIRNRHDSFCDEYDNSDEVLGRSVDDEGGSGGYSHSPSVSEFLHPASRNAAGGMSVFSFVRRNSSDQSGPSQHSPVEGIPEEEDEVDGDHDETDDLAKSFNAKCLNDTDQARLNAALPEILEVVGDTLSESSICETLIALNFDTKRALEQLLQSPRKADKRNAVFFTNGSTSQSHHSSRDLTNTLQSTPDTQSNPPQPPPGFESQPYTRSISCDSGDLTILDTPTSTTSRPTRRPPKLASVSEGESSGFVGGGVSGGGGGVRLDGDGEGDVREGQRETVGATSSCADFNRQVSAPPVLDNIPAAPRLDEKTRRAIEAEFGDKSAISIVVIGHVDAGKSTLVGQLLYKLGQVDQKTIHRYERDSKKEGKASFALAWVMDEHQDERSRGVTMEISERFFETPNKRHVTIVDAPGHKDFIPAMITGASEADAAILVIDASTNAFESGFNPASRDLSSGQTTEHAVLARSLGVTSLVVAVNKIDCCEDGEMRMKEIKGVVMPFLTKKAGFKPSDITFLPCSGLTSANLTSRDLTPSWHTGPTLVQALDALPEVQRPVDQGLVMAVMDVGKTVIGVVKTGWIKHNDKVLLQPANILTTAKSIAPHGRSTSSTTQSASGLAIAGSHVSCVLTCDVASIVNGSYIVHPSAAMKVTRTFKARIVTFAAESALIMRGSSAELHYINIQEPVHVSKIHAIVDKATGAVIKKNPKFVPPSSSALVTISCERCICVQLFTANKALGRFMLRHNSATIAAGIVTDVVT